MAHEGAVADASTSPAVNSGEMPVPGLVQPAANQASDAAIVRRPNASAG